MKVDESCKRAGIEPATSGYLAHSSTTELPVTRHLHHVHGEGGDGTGDNDEVHAVPHLPHVASWVQHQPVVQDLDRGHRVHRVHRVHGYLYLRRHRRICGRSHEKKLISHLKQKELIEYVFKLNPKACLDCIQTCFAYGSVPYLRTPCPIFGHPALSSDTLP